MCPIDLKLHPHPQFLVIASLSRSIDRPVHFLSRPFLLRPQLYVADRCTVAANGSARWSRSLKKKSRPGGRREPAGAFCSICQSVPWYVVCWPPPPVAHRQPATDRHASSHAHRQPAIACSAPLSVQSNHLIIPPNLNQHPTPLPSHTPMATAHT